MISPRVDISSPLRFMMTVVTPHSNVMQIQSQHSPCSNDKRFANDLVNSTIPIKRFVFNTICSFYHLCHCCLLEFINNISLLYGTLLLYKIVWLCHG